ncbi:MAG: ABC transporter ATP-binding protein [Bacilli bacterium]|jgi:spermidine/putrescine transport system ATP-binding protein|nr:ABC transporter ATP-binding protein [Bacilli bacterium]
MDNDNQVPLLELRNITKSFGGTKVLKGINLKINANEFVTLLGPSGCGKTTTLRIIGGFEAPTSGEVLFQGKDITFVPPYQRSTNTVFQSYALFPHLDVYDNIAFGLRLHQEEHPHPYPDGPLTFTEKIKKSINKTTKKYTEAEIEAKVNYAIKLVNLTGMEHRNVTHLSGGQRQRVAIARAIVLRPKLLLLDESLSALDLKLRKEMQYELKELQRSTGITFVFVTHDQEEALTMSDKIVVMKDGLIEQIGTAEEIYNEPTDRYVANFIGDSNILVGKVIDEKHVEFDGEQFLCPDISFPENSTVDVLLRPEDLDIVYPSKGKLTGIVDSIFFKGVFYEVDVKLDNQRIITIHTTDYIPVGKYVGVNFDTDDIHLMEVM